MGFDVNKWLKVAGAGFKGVYFWLEKVAIVIGVMGGLKGASDLWQTWRPNYELEITRSAPVKLTYYPKQKELIFAFGLNLNNKGTTSDAIERIGADLCLTTDSSRHCAFGDLDITFNDGNNQIPKNSILQKETSKSVTCEMGTYMTDELRAMFHLHETRRELLITLFGHGQRSYPVRFFFDFGEDVAATLFESSKKEPVTLTFLGSDVQ